MMKGPIKRISRNRLESREHATLTCAWIGGETKPAKPRGMGRLTRLGTTQPPAGSQAVVLGMLRDDGGEAAEELTSHTASGARTYLLVGPTWDGGRFASDLLRSPRVLVRRIAEVPATALHVPTESRIWVGGPFTLRLEQEQADALRQCFLRLFWHEATEEAWSGGRQFAWSAARERPFDVPELPARAQVRLEPPDAELQGAVERAVLHLSGGSPPALTPRRLWFPAGPEHHDRLAELSQKGTEILWDHRDLPDMLVGGDTGEILLPGSRHRLRIRLSSRQYADASRLMDADGRWYFRTNVRISDPTLRQESFWQAGDARPRKLEEEQLIEVPEVAAASLRSMPEASPSSFPTAQPLALAVRYRWTVVPPRLPASTQEDALVGRWRQLDDDWSSRLARLRESLRSSEGERGRIGRAFSRLMGAMLGFERTHSGLLAQVTKLEGSRPSAAGPSGAPGLFIQLADLEDRARKHHSDLEEAEHKAREEEEREKQEVAWQRKVDEANQALPAKRSALQESEARRASIAEELGSLEEQTKKADKKEKKDRAARQRGLSDELRRVNKEVKRFRGEITALEERAAEAFVFRPPSQPTMRPRQGGGRFVPTGASARQAAVTPEEALPEVGELRSRKGQRYLVIQSWEELAAGEQAASRLSAKLVAPENA